MDRVLRVGVLDCDVSERDFGLAYPVVLVSFANGSRFLVEFTELAPPVTTGRTVDDARAFRGAWIEFRTNDLEGYQQNLRSAGIPAFRHTGSAHTYFSAPGGQVFRLIDVAYNGPWLECGVTGTDPDELGNGVLTE
jgi:hypothetical protein